jgi:acyl-CoA dehydrogenase
MTEPEVASSDAGNISTSILRDGDDYVVNGNTWWISGAADERCTVFIVMGKTDPGPDHRATPADLRLPSWCFDNVRVPAANLLAGPGDGFVIAQARLGPDRIHHAIARSGWPNAPWR